MREHTIAAIASRLDAAEVRARHGRQRERALAFAQVALDAARNGETARMARCLEAAQREGRGIPLYDQVEVFDRLAHAAIAAGAVGFARVLHGMAYDCACQLRKRAARREALTRCAALGVELDATPPLSFCA
jgi:hypothetical protein